MSEGLPRGWVKAAIGEIANLQLGKMLDKARNLHGQPYPYLRNINVRWFSFDTSDLFEMRFEDDEAAKFSIVDGDVLVCEGGEPGRAAVWRDGPTKLKYQKALHRVRPGAAILPSWITLFLKHMADSGLLEDHFTGTTIKHLPAQALAAIRLPVPPLAEQRRIVAQIEALLARTHLTREQLGRVAGQVRRFWEAAIERAYEPNFDAGWTNATAADLAEIKSGITLGKRYPPDARLVERPYLRVANVQRGHLHLADVKSIQVSKAEAERLILRLGDVLMNEGGDRDKLGRGWVWNDEIPGCIHQNHVFRLRLKTDAVTPTFLSRYANHFGQRYFLDEGKQTTNLASISLSRVAALPVPVPPPGDAAKVDAQLDAIEAKAAVLTSEVVRALALLNHLDAAILTRAFRGELVPQDPADEPAATLLARMATTSLAITPRRNRTRAA